MGEQQQEQITVAKPGSSSTALAVVVIIAVAAIIVWLGWGSDIKNAMSPAPVQPAAKPQAVKPPEPARPHPTVRAAVTPAKTIAAKPNGAFDFGGVYGFVIHYDPSWHGVDQQYGFAFDEGYPLKDENRLEAKAKWTLAGGAFDWHHVIQRTDPRTLDYNVSLKSEAGVQTNALAMGINLPVAMYSGQQIIIDGQPIKLPVDSPISSAAAALVPDRIAQCVEIATPVGRIAFDGPVPIMVQDNRAYGGDVYYIRLGFTPSRGTLTDTQLKLKLRLVPGPSGEAPQAQPEAPPPAPAH